MSFLGIPVSNIVSALTRPDLKSTGCVAVVACGGDGKMHGTPCEAAAAKVSIFSYSDLSSCGG